MDIEKLYEKIGEARRLFECSSLPVYLLEKAVVVWFYFPNEFSKGVATIDSIYIANENLEINKMSADDDYEIVDLSSENLQKELHECLEKLKAIREISCN